MYGAFYRPDFDKLFNETLGRVLGLKHTAKCFAKALQTLEWAFGALRENLKLGRVFEKARTRVCVTSGPMLSQKSENQNSNFLELSIAWNIYLFIVNNRNRRKSSETCSKLMIKIPERHHWHCFGVFIVNFKYIWHLF